MKERLQELDALRGIAALLVVCFHYTMTREITNHGWILGITGVDLFFIISGFVIFMSVHDNSSPQSFIKRRFFRLFPVYWTVVTFTAILIVFNFTNDTSVSELTVLRYLANLTMAQQYFEVESLDGPYWTMLVELQFYVIIAFAVWMKKLKFVLVIGSGIIGLLLINELVIQPVSPTMFGWLFFKAEQLLPILGHFPFFFAGILFYKIYKKEANWLIFGGVAICFITALLIFQSIGTSRYFIDLPQYMFMTCLYFGVFILFIKNHLSFIVNPITLFLGRISYALYLIHQFLGIHLIIPYLEKEYHIHYTQGIIISIAVAFFLSFLITKYIEEPSIRYYRRIKSV